MIRLNKNNLLNSRTQNNELFISLVKEFNKPVHKLFYNRTMNLYSEIDNHHPTANYTKIFKENTVASYVQLKNQASQ